VGPVQDCSELLYGFAQTLPFHGLQEVTPSVTSAVT